MASSTPRLGLQYPSAVDQVSAFPGGPSSQAMTVLDAAMLITEGTISARPAAGTYGKAYYATDTVQFSLDTGSAWLPVGWTISNITTSVTAVSRTVYRAGGGSNVTVTLPSPTLNSMVWVMNYMIAGTTLTVSGTNIYGTGLNAVSSFQLSGSGSFAILLADGTNWFIVAGAQDSGWVAVSGFSNSWTNAGAGTPAAAYRLVGDRVSLRGAIASGSAGKAFTLPAGYRPTGTAAWLCTNAQASGTNTLYIDTTGAVTTSGTTTASLEPISFTTS